MKKILLIFVAIISLLALTSCVSSDECEVCDYRGRTQCTSCQEEAYDYSSGIIRCVLCEGRGHVEGNDCLFCGARGYSVCTSCKGNGWVDCPFCNQH